MAKKSGVYVLSLFAFILFGQIIIQRVWASKPEELLDLYATILDMGKSDKFLVVANETGMAKSFRDGEQFTVIAFTDEAYEKLDAKSRYDIEFKDDIKLEFFHEYLIEGNYNLAQLVKLAKVKNVAGKTLLFNQKNNKLFINGIPVLNEGMQAQNGYVYQIDTPLSLKAQ